MLKFLQDMHFDDIDELENGDIVISERVRGELLTQKILATDTRATMLAKVQRLVDMIKLKQSEAKQ